MELAERLKDYQCSINVIPLNPVPEFAYRPSSREKIEAFCAVLEKAGLNVNIRRRKGSGINAACGQPTFLKKVVAGFVTAPRSQAHRLGQMRNFHGRNY